MCIIKSIRLWGRKKYDSLYCKKWSDIECLGVSNSWHVLTTNLDENSVIYSAGVGHDISFEKALVSRFNVHINLFDPSPTGIQTMEMAENRTDKIHFYPIGLAGQTGIVRFAAPAMEHEGSFRIPGNRDTSIEFQCSDLFSLMKERGHSKIDLLKMDIEGFEYDVIDDLLQKSLDIKQICLEFHHFMSDISRRKTFKAIAGLKASGFILIYKTRYDYTFIRKS
jgi:FkbM family methyltransferase